MQQCLGSIKVTWQRLVLFEEIRATLCELCGYTSVRAPLCTYKCGSPTGRTVGLVFKEGRPYLEGRGREVQCAELPQGQRGREGGGGEGLLMDIPQQI